MEVAFLKHENATLKEKIASLEAHVEKISRLHDGIVKGHSDYIAEQAKHLDFLTDKVDKLQAELAAMKADQNPK